MIPRQDHPTDLSLSALLSGGLNPAEVEQVLLHLDNCKFCDDRLEEVEPLLAQYRKVRAASLPASPIWSDFSAALDRLDAKTPQRSRFPAWAGLMAAGLALCALFLLPAGHPAELRAEALLKEAQKSAPPAYASRRLHVSTAAGSFIRPAVLATKASDGVGARFAAAHYDWRDPLSPESYSKWRDGLRSKSVEVHEKDGRARIETSTSEGDLVRAFMTISTSDMRVVSGRFEFSDKEWVEIETTADAAEEVHPHATLPRSRGTSAPSATILRSLPERELQVWAAIDRLNLNAGVPVSVEIGEGESILIATYGLNSNQEQQLRASLLGIGGTALRPIDSNTAPPSERIAEPAIDSSESIVSRTHLLAKLAERFPSEVEAAFSFEDRRTLWQIRTRNASLINRDMEALAARLGKEHSLSAREPSSVPLSINNFVESATLVDRLVTSLFTSTTSDSDWSRLEREFARLRSISAAYARSLGQEPTR